MDITALQEWTQKISELAQIAFEQFPRFIGGFIVFFLFLILSKRVYTTLRNFLKHRKSLDHNPIVNFISRLVQIVIIIGGAIIALGIMDLDKTVTSILAGAGIVAFALGFAFQDLAENFIAGILLAVKQPCTVGDIVRVKGVEGIVQRIDIRETVLHSFDGHVLVIPNKEIINNVLENVSGTGERRVRVDCGVGYDTDLEQARKIAITTVMSLKECNSEKEIVCFYNAFGESSINFTLMFWITEHDKQPAYLAAKSAAIIAIKQAFAKEQINIPFPTRRILMDK